MVAFAVQSVALVDNLPNAADRTATILLKAQAALARLKGMNYEATRLIALSGR